MDTNFPAGRAVERIMTELENGSYIARRSMQPGEYNKLFNTMLESVRTAIEEEMNKQLRGQYDSI